MAELKFAELQELAAEILGVDPDEVQMDKSFQKDLAADSLDLVELIAAIEDHFDVELPEEELEKMHRISDLWVYLEAHTSAAREA
jgi:acyl carrier protein